MFKRSLKFWIVYTFLSIFLITWYLHDRKIDEYRKCVKARAIVIDKLLKEMVGPDENYNYPQYMFRYNDSTYISADRNSALSNLSIGDSVTVVFRQDNPGDAVVYKFIS